MNGTHDRAGGLPAPGAATEVAASAQGGAMTDGSNDEQIRRAAYFLAEQRGFVPGHELDDWLAAEASLCVALHPPATASSALPAQAEGVHPRRMRERKKSLQRPSQGKKAR